jgi:uncharacterized protein YaaW (UPF0174 family)
MWKRSRLKNKKTADTGFIKVQVPMPSTLAVDKIAYEIHCASYRLTIPSGFIVEEVRKLKEALSC